jgi:DNA invertase Pin-like site-specific DNA recombinase
MPTAQNVKSVNGLDQTAKPRAYSYVRFSTPEQAQGDSFERQAKKAAEYANAHGLELDTSLTFADRGVSAFRGKNAATGALRVFLDMVEAGDIPQGSFLLVESLDRISRDQVLAAQTLFNQIILAGVTLVTLMDNKAYSKENVNANPTDLIIAILSMIRAHEESAVKSMRVAGAYERKRERAAAGDKSKPFTRRLPAWLQWDDESKQFQVRDVRGEIVHAMFEKAVAGWGLSKIARWLNDQHTPTWGNAQEWDKSYVKKILTSSAVIGTFAPHKKLVDGDGKRRRKPTTTTIENYFPAVVERELFDAVALRFATTTARGRHANREVRSLFAGVLRCSRCGSTVSRVTKGAHVYLACAKAYSIGTHPYQTIRYELAEKVFRRQARGIIKDAPRTNDEDLEQQIRKLGVNIDAGEMLVRELVDELVSNKSEAVRRRLQQAETELEKSHDELRTLIARRDALAPDRVERKLQALLAALTRKPFDVAVANGAMRQAIKKIVMDAENGELLIYWHHVADDADPQVVVFPRFQRVATSSKRTRRPKQSQATPTTLTTVEQ